MMNTVRKWIIWIWREVVQPKLRPSDRKLLKMCISGIILLGGGKLSFYCYGVTIRKEEEGYQAFFDLNDNPLDICTVIVIGFLTIITIALIVKIYLSEKKRKIPDTLVVTYSAMIAADRPQIDFSLACKALPKTIMPLEHPFEIKNDRGSVGLASSPKVPIMLFNWDDTKWKLDLIETLPLITKGIEATAAKKNWTGAKLALYWLDKKYHLQYSRLDESLFEPIGF